MVENKSAPKEILDKIKKLLALAESANKVGSMAEAENAMSKVQDLLLKYNLEMGQINTHSDKPTFEFSAYDAGQILPNNEGRWIIGLSTLISKYNFCKSFTINNGSGGIRIVGTAQNIEIVRYIIDQLVPKIRTIAKQSFREYELNGGPEKRNTFIRGFLVGAVSGLATKLRDQRDAAIRDSENGEQIYGLILRKDTALAEFIEQHLNLKQGRVNPKLTGNHGKTIGYEKGQGLEINKGLHSAHSNSRMLN